jgi:hypothetical protein
MYVHMDVVVSGLEKIHKDKKIRLVRTDGK